jgi:GxxExxY protein
MLLAESLTEQVIGLAIAVHRNTGRGLREAVYQRCLYVEWRGQASRSHDRSPFRNIK